MKKSGRAKHQHAGRGAPGTAPGSLIVDPKAPKPQIQVIAFGPDELIEREIARPSELRNLLRGAPVSWVNVDGLGDAAVLQEIADIFQLHPLAMEDVVNVHQRAKVDQFGPQTFVVTNMVALAQELETEQVSVFLVPMPDPSAHAKVHAGEHRADPDAESSRRHVPASPPKVGETERAVVLTFQERPGGDSFDQVRARIRKPLSRLRELGADYLAYALIDAVIDHYFPVLEVYGERLELLEDKILERPDGSVIAEIHAIKRDLLTLRRTIWPLREAVNSLVRDPIPLISDETRLYLRDCYDHAVRIIDLVETYREICSDLMDLYLSSVSNRMNEIMKVLTVMSTLFIPLTFIVGIYGMNFDVMPELSYKWGYPICWAVMITVFFGQLTFLWRKGWLRKFETTRAADSAGEDAPS